jgi:hypothetical protein
MILKDASILIRIYSIHMKGKKENRKAKHDSY